VTASYPDTGRRPSADDRIIEATLSLIARRGLGSITMREIAEAAGVARQTLYNHYRDVDAIVAEAIGRHHHESIEMIDAALGVVDEPDAGLEQLVRHAVTIGAHAHHASGLEHGLSPGARAALAAHDDAVEDRIRTILVEGIETGAFRADLDPDIDAVLIRHLLAGLTHMAGTESDAAALAATGTRTVLAAVTTTAPHPPDASR
jgi:AcrR family transcriptional regulator